MAAIWQSGPSLNYIELSWQIADQSSFLTTGLLMITQHGDGLSIPCMKVDARVLFLGPCKSWCIFKGAQKEPEALN